MESLNQHSFVIAAVLGLGVLWFILRRRGRWLRRSALLATVALLAIVYLSLRPGTGDLAGPAELDRALALGRPVALELYSNY